MKKLFTSLLIAMMSVTSAFADNNINQITSANIKEKTNSQEKTHFTLANDTEQEIINNGSSEKIKITVYIDKIISDRVLLFPDADVPDTTVPALDMEYINANGNSVHHLDGFFKYYDRKIIEGDEASGFLTTILLAPGERVVLSTKNIFNYDETHGVSGRYTIESVKD